MWICSESVLPEKDEATVRWVGRSRGGVTAYFICYNFLAARVI